jgi:hypothetical protein
MRAAVRARHVLAAAGGKHVSYRQSSIISGGHIVGPGRGSGAASGARTKAESGGKRLSRGSGPASSSFTLWASLCALRKCATPDSAGRPCSACCSPAGNSASSKHASQTGRTAPSGAAAGNSAGDSRPCCRKTGHSATSHSVSQCATSGNEFVAAKWRSGRGLRQWATHGCLRPRNAWASAQPCGRQNRRRC